jgi:ABC1 atypical kinase-like domain
VGLDGHQLTVHVPHAGLRANVRCHDCLHPASCFAQVHRAVGRDGRQLAVKVQHAGLRESGAADTATIGLAVALLRYFVPDYDYRWVVDETRTSLPLVGAFC